MNDPPDRAATEGLTPPDEPWPYKSALVVVAHPDDETLWAGGTILMHPDTQWTIVSLCRRSDSDRAPKFMRALGRYGASGVMGNLDDGPDQEPLDTSQVAAAVLALVDQGAHDLILTHDTCGEYTRHRRHEEIGKAMIQLWDAGTLFSSELWTFAYRDEGAGSQVSAVADADLFTMLPEAIWNHKRDLIMGVYAFAEQSFEARCTLREEAFWRARVR